MGLLADFWTGLPKEVKLIFGISVFMYAGSTILQVMVIAWNLLGVNAMNVVNGCLQDSSLCMPYQEGIFVFGINLADYWTITGLIFFPVLILFAIKWYALIMRDR